MIPRERIYMEQNCVSSECQLVNVKVFYLLQLGDIEEEPPLSVRLSVLIFSKCNS